MIKINKTVDAINSKNTNELIVRILYVLSYLDFPVSKVEIIPRASHSSKDFGQMHQPVS